MLGALVGQYRVTSLIGQGGMGAVYAAEHTLLGRPAAIKVLLPQLSRQQDIVTRFFNEARAATAIRHPSIVEIYDFGWAPDGSAYIVMEHLQGEPLSRRALRGRLRWSAALVIARQIAGALAAAHAKSIVHRDLKPDNVFLVPDSEVPGGERIKLLDFGIAKLAGDQHGGMNNMTRTGSVMGTPTYMAPEQCRGVAVDARADLYALGCIIFELCAGRPPFIGEGSGDVLAAHIHVPPPALSSLVPDVLPDVTHLVGRLLAKLPSERVQSAEEVIHAIDTILSAHPSTGVGPTTGANRYTGASAPTTLSGMAHGGTRPPQSAGRGRALGIGIGLGIVGAVAVVAVAMRGGGGESGGAMTGDGPGSAVVVKEAAGSGASVEPTRAAPAGSTRGGAKVDAGANPAAEPDAGAGSDVGAGAGPGSNVDATVALSITTMPAGARVIVDSRELGKTPFTAMIAHEDRDVTVVLKLSGYADKRVVIHPDHAIAQTVKLAKLAPAAARPKNRDESVNPFGD